MELIELENIWKEYDKKVSDNIRLNKDILRRILVIKPERRLNWIKIKSVVSLFSPLIFLIVVLIMNLQFHFTINFYIGLSLFVPAYLIGYWCDIQYFLSVRKINFSDTILTIKKNILKLEKYKIKITQVKYMLMPIAIAGAFLMLFQKMVFNTNTAIMLLLIILVIVSSCYYTFKYSIQERFRRLNQEIEEIENIEKE